MTISRRSFIAGLIAAPAVVKAINLMPMRGIIMEIPPQLNGNALLTIQMITCEAVKLFQNSNQFLMDLNAYEIAAGPTIAVRMPIKLWRERAPYVLAAHNNYVS